ncbi:(2Fe-2S)-binding protein [Seohaeicola sp. SP36]|uniref:(2Fe-2S)-binding protein n=1 Tax=unclassified Seohaeicola TaxID=2641111 RepID=UPI00237A4106|nr:MULTISPECIES: (2Fe-2S)-binding protein [unclassified Seohaeicola]MDD9707704.1 (2Fe-2S)-binding protein [Seohaeicola sp. 4SK31]MDD9735946.1 (2Fe-2S)-binding protein [Seohaeicola sp. SP36]
MTEAFRDRIDIALTVNGEAVEGRVPAGRHLIDFLRLDLGLTGSHASCEHGVCGACTIHVDGQAVRGCLMLAAQADGAEVWTLEGLTETGVIRDLQDAFVERNALQCGYCTPGMLASIKELLDMGGVPDRATIREHLSGNYCRCTGYEAIIDAVESVAKVRAGGAAA